MYSQERENNRIFSTRFKVTASRSDAAQFKAAAAGKMKLDGAAHFAQWFNEGVKLVLTAAGWAQGSALPRMNRQTLSLREVDHGQY